MSWAEDAKRLLDGVGCFHDACLREMHLFTETSVDERLFGLPLRGEPNSTVRSVERGPVIRIFCGGLRWREASSWMGAQLRYESGAP